MSKFNEIHENLLSGLAKVGAKAIRNNQGSTIYDTAISGKSRDWDENTDKTLGADNTEANKVNNINQKLKKINITDLTNWTDLTNKIKKNKGKIFIELGSPTNMKLEFQVDINSLRQGEKTKTFLVSLLPKDAKNFAIVKATNPKNKKIQDLIVLKASSKNKKFEKFAQIGYNTFYDVINVYDF